MKKNTLDLTKGPITKLLLQFAFPIFLASVFQQLYNTADTMIVGHYLGDKALAAVGSSVAIYELLVGFATGVGSGFSIVVARFFGSKNETELKKSVAATIILSIILSIIIMLLSFFVLMPFLEILKTPKEIIQQTHSYIFIICMAVSITMAYNLTAGLLRAIGNSLTPLIVLIFASFINIGLDILFVSTFKMGIAGAAYATVIAQAFSAIVCIFYIWKRCHLLVPKTSDFKYEKDLYADLITQGTSMGLMLSIVSLGTLILQGAINGFGTLTIAAHTTARKLSSLFMMPISTLASAVATFASQNKGAKQMLRVRESVKKAMYISFIWSTIVIIICLLFSPQMVQMLSGSNKETVISTGALYLRTNAPFYLVLGPLLILRSALQGIGKKIVPLISSGIELLGKLAFVFFLIPFMGYLGVCFSEPIIWICMSIQLLYTFYRNDEIKAAKQIKIL